MSRKQRAANRRNAKKSTGPKTAEGKQTSRLNSVVHGLYSTVMVLNREDKQVYNGLYVGFRERFRPVDAFELDLVERLVCCSWQMRRITAIEAGVLHMGMHEVGERPYMWGEEIGPRELLGEAFRPDGGKCQPTLEAISLQRGRWERSYFKTLHELERVQAERPAHVPTTPLPIEIPFPEPPPGSQPATATPEPPPEPPAEPAPAAPAEAPDGFVSQPPPTPTNERTNRHETVLGIPFSQLPAVISRPYVFTGPPAKPGTSEPPPPSGRSPRGKTPHGR